MVREFVIDGRKAVTLEAFYDEVSRVLIPGVEWGQNLDAFNDILRGGFGTPEALFLVRWADSAMSRELLSYPETVRQLEMRLRRCHPSSRVHVSQELEAARAGKGPTAFDWLIDILRDHEKDGDLRLILD